MNLFIGVKPCPFESIGHGHPSQTTEISTVPAETKEGIYQNCHKCDWHEIDERTINFSGVAQMTKIYQRMTAASSFSKLSHSLALHKSPAIRETSYKLWSGSHT